MRPETPIEQIPQDLFGWPSLNAAIRSLRETLVNPPELPSVLLTADGVQQYPADDALIWKGKFPQEERVQSSVVELSGRYASFTRLSTVRLGYLEALLLEARAAHVGVTAFIPPVHPALERAAAGGELPRRTQETIDTLRGFERAGLLRYVETRSLSDFGGDRRLYYDAVHFMSGNAERLLGVLLGHAGGCALQ